MGLLYITWILYTVTMLLFGLPVVFYPNAVPLILQRIFMYGKSNKGYRPTNYGFQANLLHWIQLPKRYFTHFYIFATCYSAVVTGVLLSSYYYQNVPLQIVKFLDIVAGENRTTKVGSVATIVAMLLYLGHVSRRTYESLFVSVYSPACKMNIFHCFLAFTFYFGATTSLLTGAPGFTSEGFQHELFQQLSWKWYQVFGIALYFWAVWHQYKSAAILASLRKDKKGQVVTRQHKIPKGDWFYFVSCPHYFAEILIYSALNIVLEFNNTLFLGAWAFTCSNQIIAALITHHWYLKTFKEYPRNRKAIIPFVL